MPDDPSQGRSRRLARTSGHGFPLDLAFLAFLPPQPFRSPWALPNACLLIQVPSFPSMTACGRRVLIKTSLTPTQVPVARERLPLPGRSRSHLQGNRPADPSCVGAGCSGRMGG